MRFAREASGAAAGAILAHTLRGPGFAFKKGRRLSAADSEQLLNAGIDEVMVARLDVDDVGEDEAAAAVAAALAGGGLRVAAAFTGRCNLYAQAAGIATIAADRIAAVNAVNEAITVATLPPFARVDPRQMVATVKIIPFAVPRPLLERVLAVAVGDGAAAAIAAAPFRPRRVALIQTTLPGQKATLPEQTRRVMAARIEDLGSALADERVVPHGVDALAAALGKVLAAEPATELVLIVGASAIVDRRDVIPAAMAAAGATVERFGMPVEPGNLILLGRLGAAAVIGLPGCARSPKLNGFDWVLERLCAGLAVDGAAIAAMGVGGLLVESKERRPRERLTPAAHAEAQAAGNRQPQIAAVVLAAGRGSRFGVAPKLAATDRGEALLRHPIRAALAAGAAPVIVVLGHEAARLRPLIEDLPVSVVSNADFAAGLAGSLARGLAAVPDEADGALVLLGDMPRVTAAHLGRLIAAFDVEEGRIVCVPTYGGRRGNPVLWGRALFAELSQLRGDQGGRALFDRHAEVICEVAMADDGVLFDVDEPAALAAAAHDG